MNAFKDYEVDYVFQSEIYTFKEILALEGVFNEANSQFSSDIINSYVFKKTGIMPPFKKYFQFDSPAAWRQASSSYDIYVGDRIHGAVAALQSGIPVLIIYDDIRVKELASYFFLPSASVEELETLGLKALIDERVNQEWLVAFKNRYQKVISKFVRETERVGLNISHTKDVNYSLKYKSS